MLGLVEVFGGMLVLRRIAAAHVPAAETFPQMDPGVAHLEAFFAALAAGFNFSNFPPVGTGSARHGTTSKRNLRSYSPSSSRNFSASSAAMQPEPAAVMAWR